MSRALLLRASRYSLAAPSLRPLSSLSSDFSISNNLCDAHCHHRRHYSSTLRRQEADLSKDTRTYSGVELPLTTDLKIFKPEEVPNGPYPVFRVLNEDGTYRSSTVGPSHVPPNLLTPPEQEEAFRLMTRLQQMDSIFLNAQRQGRISFYMSSTGEEATHIGSSLPMTLDDCILAQYRETGVLMHRGFTLQQFADQCFSNSSDLGKGRQMPVHYGSKALNFHTISSPLTTQLPQAVGASYFQKLSALRSGSSTSPSVTCVYFGDGAASEGDFHAALNFAATLETPTLFICRNNGFAISTPTDDQYRGDGIVSRAKGYGMYSIRVDGNDLLAVAAATAEAKRVAIEESRPVLIETMSYRVGHHSTSDDSTRYRPAAEIKRWREEDDPVERYRLWVEGEGGLGEERVQEIRDEEKINVLKALSSAEAKAPPSLDSMFEDVYKEKTAGLQRQERELMEHIKKYPERYGSGGGH